MILHDAVYIRALEEILRRTDYVFFIKQLRGVSDCIDPWYVFDQARSGIGNSGSRFKEALLLLYAGIGADSAALDAQLGAANVDLMVDAGIWRRENSRVETNNYVVIPYQGIVVLTEINPWYPSCTHANTDVYIGMDSLRLGENIVFRRGARVLDLCSGSGIQGLLAARSASRVISVELNEKAVPVTEFNIRLNHLEDVIELRAGSLYDVLDENERFDLIYANPPFIPMPDDIVYPICGGGGEDGLAVLNGIIAGLPAHLNKGGEVIIFCECLGTDTEVFFDRTIERLLQEQQWRGLCARIGWLERDAQIERIAQLSALFDQDFDADSFRARMGAAYDRLGAEYLYSLLYKLDADEYRGGRLEIYQNQELWSGRARAAVTPELRFGDDPNAFGIWRGETYTGSVNALERELLEELSKGVTLDGATTNILARHQNDPGINKTPESLLRAEMHRACERLVRRGLLRRRLPSDDMRSLLDALAGCTGKEAVR